MQIVCGEAVATITGNGFIVAVIVAVPVQPAALVPVTLYVVVDAGVSVNDEPLPDGFHEYELPPVAETVTASPAQTDDGDTLAAMVGTALTVTVTDDVPVQPAAEVPVTVYVVVDAGVTVADPLLHAYVEAPDALRVDVCPAQTAAGDALAVTVG